MINCLDKENILEENILSKIYDIFSSKSNIRKLPQNNSFMEFLTKIEFQSKYTCQLCNKLNEQIAEEESVFILDMNIRVISKSLIFNEIIYKKYLSANCGNCQRVSFHAEFKTFRRLPPILILNFIKPIDLQSIKNFQVLNLKEGQKSILYHLCSDHILLFILK